MVLVMYNAEMIMYHFNRKSIKSWSPEQSTFCRVKSGTLNCKINVLYVYVSVSVPFPFSPLSCESQSGILIYWITRLNTFVNFIIVMSNDARFLQPFKRRVLGNEGRYYASTSLSLFKIWVKEWVPMELLLLWVGIQKGEMWNCRI